MFLKSSAMENVSFIKTIAWLIIFKEGTGILSFYIFDYGAEYGAECSAKSGAK